jgi:ABC-type glycerol-3-phosphate transport system substrate-binding protein
MKYSFLFSLASFESSSWSASAETVVKILHIYPIPKVLEIWESAAVEYKKANSAVKVQFDYLESEEFKAKLPTNDRPSVFHSWGGWCHVGADSAREQ